VDAALERFDFADVAQRLYRLTFDDFCDWYAEAAKPRLRLGDEDAVATALAALERLLLLLHPVLPHVTEEIWSHLPARSSRLVAAPWPAAAADRLDDDAERRLGRLQELALVYRRSGALAADGELEEEAERVLRTVLRLDRAQGDADGAPAQDALARELRRLEQEIARCERMLANEQFVAKARPEVVAAEREKLERYRRERDALRR
jgi:valyl-tRNA synthetase